MVKLVVVDRSAESRNKIVDQLSQLLRADIPEIGFLPHISIVPLAPQELKFHAQPDICVIGDEIVAQEITEVGRIKNLLPKAAILVRTNPLLESISIIEQLARMGADDTLRDDVRPAELMRKIVMLARRGKSGKSGTLVVVDSGKGGIGVTTITAAVGEVLATEGKRVAVLDFDFETQDMSRFLQTRPFVNENLQLLLEKMRPITQEFVEQCLIPVGHGGREFVCMPPISDCEALYDSRSNYARGILSVLEVLDELFDFVLVDIGCARGAIAKSIYRAADKVMFLTSGDPSSLYASVERLNRVRAQISSGTAISLAQIDSGRPGLSNAALRNEFGRAADIDHAAWLPTALPYCKRGCRWPASGGTLYTVGHATTQRSLKKMAGEMGLLTPEKPALKESALHFVLERAAKTVLKYRTRRLEKLGRTQPHALPPDCSPEPRWLAAPEDNAVPATQTKNQNLISGAVIT